MDKLRAAAIEFVRDYEEGEMGDLKHYARALRAALAEPQQEPVAWGIIASNTGRICRLTRDAEEVADYNQQNVVPLYAHPPRREWVGLTFKERGRIYDKYCRGEAADLFDLMTEVEIALREKNGGSP